MSRGVERRQGVESPLPWAERLPTVSQRGRSVSPFPVAVPFFSRLPPHNAIAGLIRCEYLHHLRDEGLSYYSALELDFDI